MTDFKLLGENVKTKIKLQHKICLEKYWKNYFKKHKSRCLYCYKKFTSSNSRIKYCSKKCKRANNKESINKRQKEYYYKIVKNNINLKLIHNLRSRLYYAIKNNIKYGRTIELLGCSVIYLKRHLENQFKKGMSWDNYGKWHVDHIVPCCTFDMGKAEEQKKCFNYTNLQPLWAGDNIRKSNKERKLSAKIARKKT